jgi:predicted dehydrogenase
MINVAVIGLGAGHSHLNAYASVPEARVLAIADLNAARLEKVAAEQGVPHAFADYRDLLAVDQVDLVSVCLPNHLHAPVAIEALRAGKHVLVEKPMATSAAEAQTMLAAAEEHGRVLAVSMNYRWAFAPDMLDLRRRIARGDLGNIYYVRAVALRRRTFARGYRGDRDWFIDRRRSGGGGLIDMGPHMLDLAMWLAGDFAPVSVSGVARTALMVDTDVDDLAAALVRLRGGATVALEITWASFTRPGASLTLLGTRGGAMLDMSAPAGQRLTLFGEDDSGLLEMTPFDVQLPPDAERTVQEHVVRSVASARLPEVSGARGLAVMRVIDAIYESELSGREVAIAPDAHA